LKFVTVISWNHEGEKVIHYENVVDETLPSYIQCQKAEENTKKSLTKTKFHKDAKSISARTYELSVVSYHLR
jgi:hypothetical protein